MNVYVESGFVLTLALQQDDYQAAEQILQFARQGRITLKIPAFSLSEPIATVQNRGNARHRLIMELRKEIRELRRTQPYERMAEELEQHAVQMDQILRTNQNALESVALELSRTCQLLQIAATVLARASSYRAAMDLRLPDAVILASIILDLERVQPLAETLFISQDVHDFEDLAVQHALQRLQCKYLADFTNAVRFITRSTGQDA